MLERSPVIESLVTFPNSLGDWHLTRILGLPVDQLEALHADDYLDRYYSRQDGLDGIEVRVAYYRSQRVRGRLPHSPSVCLPANGWSTLETHIVRIAGGEVNEISAAKGEARATVIYWYRTPWQMTARELPTRAYVALNGILHWRTDAALMTVITSDSRSDEALRLASLADSAMHSQLN